MKPIDKLFTGDRHPYGFTEHPLWAGWTVEAHRAAAHTLIHHSGGMGTSNYLLLVPELNLAIAATGNASTGITPIIAKPPGPGPDQDQQAVETCALPNWSGAGGHLQNRL